MMAATKLVLEHEKFAPAQAPTPTHEEIELRAYQIWQTRMRHGIEGTAGQDWQAAEQELAEAIPDSSDLEPAEV